MPRTITTTSTATDSAGNSATATKDFVVDSVPSDYDRILTGSIPGGFTVPEGEAWKITGTVEVDANVVVNGLLVQGPGDWLQFRGINEVAYVGGGMDVLPTDVGLWIMGNGQWDCCGTEKVGWNRTGDDPSWNDSDECVSTPIAKGDYLNFKPFTPGWPVPSTTIAGREFRAEILNLTRDCGVKGEPGARPHVFIHSNKPQRVCHALIQHVAPRQVDATFTKEVLGRYGLHFHHSLEGSRGSLIESVVVRDCGSHAFVPHASHGIKFYDCIAFNSQRVAFWWDLDHISDDIEYRNCVCALLIDQSRKKGLNMDGFSAMVGDRNVMDGCVAVGVQGRVNSSGFGWPEVHDRVGVWEFTNNVAHNNKVDGIFVWQNDRHLHEIKNYVAYRNGQAGIDQGAYGNAYRYEDIELFENGLAGIQQHNSSRYNDSDGRPHGYRNVNISGSPIALKIRRHQLPHSAPTVWEDCCFDAPQPVVVDHNVPSPTMPDRFPGYYRFINVTKDGRPLEKSDVTVINEAEGTIYEFV